MQSASVVLGLGANLGRPVEQLVTALGRLASYLDIAACSSVYQSEPVGGEEQPDFFNVVCVARTRLDPGTLLAATQGIEQALGRVRTIRNAARSIDIDVLAYGDLLLDTPNLTVPHPRMAERAFVLVPLAEVAPEWKHPVLGQTAREIFTQAGRLERIRRWGPLPRVP